MIGLAIQGGSVATIKWTVRPIAPRLPEIKIYIIIWICNRDNYNRGRWQLWDENGSLCRVGKTRRMKISKVLSGWGVCQTCICCMCICVYG